MISLPDMFGLVAQPEEDVWDLLQLETKVEVQVMR